MPAPQSISLYLNNALKAIPQDAELDCGLPDVIREMPDDVSGHFINLNEQTAHEIEAASKRVMILNQTRVLYTFTYNPESGTFSAHKR